VKSGATGYLVKSAAREELLDAVRRTAAGDPVFTPGLAGLVLGEFRRLAAEGLSYRQIAERLVLSHRTVQNHVQNTLGKLQLHNRVELVRYAIEQGLAGEFEAGEQAELPSGKRRPATGCSACPPAELADLIRSAPGSEKLLSRYISNAEEAGAQ